VAGIARRKSVGVVTHGFDAVLLDLEPTGRGRRGGAPPLEHVRGGDAGQALPAARGLDGDRFGMRAEHRQAPTGAVAMQAEHTERIVLPRLNERIECFHGHFRCHWR
jgi:hypothetical protein